MLNLQTYNTLQMYYNLKIASGTYAAEKFAASLSRETKIEILKLHNKIKVEGFENVRRTFIRESNGS